MRSVLNSAWTKRVLFLACLAPLAYLIWRAYERDLTANPIEFITHRTGDWTLRFVVLTLAITPLRMIPGLGPLIRFRRMLGLFAFFYGCLHSPHGSGSTSFSIGRKCGRMCKSGGSSRWASLVSC